MKRKNLMQVAGKSLLARSIETAINATSIDEVYVSTDDKEIQAEALKNGAFAPFLRPQEISGDLSTDIEFVTHFLSHYFKAVGEYPTFLVHLRPTVPLREPAVVDAAVIEIGELEEADSLRSVNVASVSPYKMWSRNERGFGEPFSRIKGFEEAYNAPRQLLPMVLEQNCYVDIYRVSSVLASKTLGGGKILLFETEPTVDVDTDFDLAVVRAMAGSHVPVGQEAKSSRQP